MAQEVIADNSDNESVQDLDNKKPIGEFDDSGTTELFDLLSTEAEMHTRSQKSTKQTSQSDAQKRANLPPEIFDYMHIAKYQRLFSLSWYNDQTYTPATDKAVKLLPILCCNRSSCQSEEPAFLKRRPFIHTPSIKYTKTMREWIACKIVTLKK